MNTESYKWPTHPDGRLLKMGEMSGQQRKDAIAASLARLGSALLPNPTFDDRTAKFRVASIWLQSLAGQVDEVALLLDDTASTCECCGTARFANWPQQQLRARVVGAGTRLREIAETFERRSADPEFLGNVTAGTKVQRALVAIDASASDANANGDVTIPSEVWDLVQQALGRGPKVAS